MLSGSWGGIPHYTAELANAAAKYADVIVMKPRDSNDELFSANVRVIDAFKPVRFSRAHEIKVLHFENIKNFLSYRNIRMIDELKPDIIHFTLAYPHVSFFSCLYRLHAKYPTIYTIHYLYNNIGRSFFVSPKGRGIFSALLRTIAELMTRITKPVRVIVHTQMNMDTLVRNGMGTNKIAVIPHGAFTFFRRYSTTIEAESENDCILFFGYISEYKGIEYLIEAVPLVSKEIPNIKVVIAGEGDFSIYSKYTGDKSRFEIYNEFIPNEKVANLFQRAKIVVFPYKSHQGHSGALTVAFSFGKPVIITNVGDLPNLLENGREGIVVPPRDPQALAEAIIKLLKNDKLRKQMGKNAANKAEELSWDNIAKKHLDLYGETIEEFGNIRRGK